MASFSRAVAATTSATVRITAFLFLRWMPGHVFPPVILTALVIYLSTIPSLYRETGPPTTDRRKGSRKAGSKQPPAQDSGLKTLLTGLPSARSPLLTGLTVLINIVLGLFTLDFLLRGALLYAAADLAFTRIGYVSPQTASLFVREPDSTQLPLGVYYQEWDHKNPTPWAEDPSQWTQEGTIYALTNSTDFTASITLKGLKPSTKYRYALSNNRTGSFTTAPQQGSEQANSLSFLTSSCMKPNFPYNPLAHPLRIYGLETMAETVRALASAARPTFMMFLGDFIYIDVPQRLGSSVAHYRSEYRRIYSSPSWSGPEELPAIDLPWIHTMDDHEIENDWSKGNTTAPYTSAVEPYIHYHVSVNPPIPASAFATPENTTYFTFTDGPASFFMLDTRAYRTEPAHDDSTILGSAQLQSLLAFLARPEPSEVHWKIVASSVPFTKNWHVGTTDTWGGFLNERRTVFEAMWRAEREQGIRIVLLSGDRHEFGATRFPDPTLALTDDELRPDTPGEGLHEFSVGPLSMFYLPVPTYYQTDPEDVAIKYIPDGNVKYGLIDIDTVEETLDGVVVSSSALTYSLYVDGEVVWKYRLSVPLHGLPAKPFKHPILPPGKVLLDERPAVSWVQRIKDLIGGLQNRL